MSLTDGVDDAIPKKKENAPHDTDGDALAESTKLWQVVTKGPTVDLLIDLFWMSMQGARPELSCPDLVSYKI